MPAHSLYSNQTVTSCQYASTGNILAVRRHRVCPFRLEGYSRRWHNVGVPLHFEIEPSNTFSYSYPTFDSRIDHLLPDVRRIEWSHDVSAMPMSPIFDPTSQGIACELVKIFKVVANILQGQNHPKMPALKAPVRAGGNIKMQWTEIIRMHVGPTMAVSYS